MQTTAFRSLHQQVGHPLVLPNAWDAGSARIVESLGAKAVATTSAGVAWAAGHPDGNRMPVDELTRIVRGIVRVVAVPVSIDVESGYADDPATVAERLQPLVELGIAGINIEDGADAPDLLARKLEAIRRRTEALGLDLFVNVRTDVYLRGLVPDPGKVSETLARADLYRAAGADGLFVPGLRGPVEIAEISSRTPLALNVMSVPGLPAVAKLGELGVRRLSAGSAIAQVVCQRISRLAEAFLASGDSGPFFEEAMSYASLQALFVAPTPKTDA